MDQAQKYGMVAAMEQEIIQTSLGVVMTAAGEQQRLHGPGIIIKVMDPETNTIPVWRPLSHIPDAVLSEVFSKIDCGKGVYGMMFIYPTTLSAWVIDVTVGAAFSEVAGKSFHVLRHHLIEGQMYGPAGPMEEKEKETARRQFRPGDLGGDDEDFL